MRDYVGRTKDKYPEGAGVVLLWDSSKRIKQRQDSMNQNLCLPHSNQISHQFQSPHL